MNQEGKCPLFLTVSSLKELKEENKITVSSSSANLLFPSLILPSPTPSQSSSIASSLFSFSAQSSPGSNVTITEKVTNNLIHESTRRKEREGESIQENPVSHTFFPSPDPLEQAANPSASTNGTPLEGSRKPAGEEKEGERETSSIENGGTTQAATLLFKGITTTRRSGTETKTGEEEEESKGNVVKEREVGEKERGKKGDFLLLEEKEGRKVKEEGEEREKKGNWCSTSLQLTSQAAGKEGGEESLFSFSSHIQSSSSELFSSIKSVVSFPGHCNDQGLISSTGHRSDQGVVSLIGHCSDQGQDLNSIQNPSTATISGLANTVTREKSPSTAHFTASLSREMTKTTASSDSTTGCDSGASTTNSEESVTIGSSDNPSLITSSSSTKSSSVSEPSIPSLHPSSPSSAPSSSTAECTSDTVTASNSAPLVAESSKTKETTIATDVVETTHSTASSSLPSLSIPSHSNPLPSTSSSSSPALSTASSLSQVTALSQNASSANEFRDKVSPSLVSTPTSSLEQLPSLSTTIVTQSSQGGLGSSLPGKTPTVTTPASVTNVSTKVSTMMSSTDSAVSSSDQGSGSGGGGRPHETSSSSQPGFSSSLSSGQETSSSSQPGSSSSLSSGQVTMSDQPTSRSPPSDPQDVTPVQMSKSPQGREGLNEASSTSSDPNSNLMKRGTTLTAGSSESILSTNHSVGDGGDQETDTHGTPAKRSKRSSSASRSTNNNSSNMDDGIQSFPPSSVPSSAFFPNEAMPSLIEGVKDTTSFTGTPTTMTTSSPSDTILPRLKQQQAPPTVANVIQCSQASGHEDITDSEEEDEGKMMIDEDASSDREAKTGPVTLSTNAMTTSHSDVTMTPPVTLSTLTTATIRSGVTGSGNSMTTYSGVTGSDESCPRSPSSSSTSLPSLQPIDSKPGSNSPTSSTGINDPGTLPTLLNSDHSSDLTHSQIHPSMTKPAPVVTVPSLKVPPIRIVLSKSSSVSSPTVASLDSSGPKVSSSSPTCLNVDSISSSSSLSPSIVSSSATTASSDSRPVVTGSGLTSSATGNGRNQVSSSASLLSSKVSVGASNKEEEGGGESESDDGSENGSLGSGPGSSSGTSGTTTGAVGKNGKSSSGDKVDGCNKDGTMRTRSSKEGSSIGGRVTRSSQRVAAREKDGSHSGGSESKRESSHRLRERRRDLGSNESRDSPASQDSENHSVVSPTSSSKDGSNETVSVEAGTKSGPGRKRKGVRPGLRAKDGGSDRATPEKASRRMKEVMKDDSNQGSNQGDNDHEDNDSTSSSTSSTGANGTSMNDHPAGSTNGTSSQQTGGTGHGSVGSGSVNDVVNQTAETNVASRNSLSPTAGRESFQMPSYNSYQMYLNIRKQVEKRRKTLVPVAPKAPSGFKNYLLNRGNYLLHGKVAASSTLTNNATMTSGPPSGCNNENYNSYGFIACNSNNTSYKLPMKLSPPPGLIPGTPLFNLFLQQENERQKVRIQHTIEREKLRLSVEQEVLRVHGRAALAMANQSVPLSVCSILKDEEIYNTIEPLDGDGNSSPGHGSTEEGRNEYSKAFTNSLGQGFADLSALTGAPPAPGSRLRYNGRILVQWLADVSDKWDKIKVETLKRQRRESESLVAIQKLDWEWKLKELKLCDFKSTPVIHPDLIPSVDVTDDFHLLPTN